MKTTTPRPFDYDVDLMLTDMAAVGMLPTDLARKAKCSDMTVSRFLSKDPKKMRRTPKTAKKLARALGHTPDRYLLQLSRTAVSA
jgi:hypothetical protein